MTNNLITLTIPNDDHIALRAFGKALEEMALAHEPQQITTDATAAMDALRFEGEELQGKRREPEVDTTVQQVESLATIKPFGERMDLLDKALSKEVPESLAEKLQSYDPEPTTDSTGTPWDERIHSTSKALNADGTWRLRRKPKDMDEAEWGATVQRVQDELRFPQEPVAVTPSGEELCVDEGCDHHGTPHICITPEPPVTPPGDDFHADTGVVTEQTIAGIPPIPVPPPVVVPPTDWTFPKLMTFLTERHGKIDVTTVNTLLAQDGMLSVQELNAHPDKIGPFVARVKAHLGE